MTDAAASASSTTNPTSPSSATSSTLGGTPTIDDGNASSTIAAVVARAKAAADAEEQSGEGEETTSEGEGSAEAKGDGEKAKTDDADDKAPKVKDDPKLAGKFAALAKKSEKVRQEEQRVRSEAARVADREQRVAAHEATVSQRETAVREFETVKSNPKALLDYMIAHRVDLEAVVAYSLAQQDPAQKAAYEARAGAKTAASEEAAKVRKEFEDYKREQATREAAAARASAEETFTKEISDDTKYEATALTYSTAEATRVAYYLDGLAKKKGLSWGITEIAQAVNEFAENGYELDARGTPVKTGLYAKRKARLQPNGAQTPAAAGAASSSSAGTGPHVKPAKTLTNSSANERSTEVDLSDLPAEERIARLAAKARRGPRMLTG